MKIKRIAYQGIEGSYSHEAAKKYFGGNAILVSQERFVDVFDAVLSGECVAGLVPVENSITGSVVQNYDLLSACNCFICGEYILPVEHALLGVAGSTLEDIQQVYSHEQGLLQCGIYLSAHKSWLCIPYLNTAVSAQLVAQEANKTKAAIASVYAGEIYGLTALAQNISDRAQNSTRFAAVCAKAPDVQTAKTDYNKATILFTLRHEKGSLAAALCHLSGLNLTRIESRPSQTNWEYRFYVDLEGDLLGFQDVMQGLGAFCTSVRLLGMYKSAK
jgi:chorismate mutase / prephenate dehydratase